MDQHFESVKLRETHSLICPMNHKDATFNKKKNRYNLADFAIKGNWAEHVVDIRQSNKNEEELAIIRETSKPKYLCICEKGQLQFESCSSKLKECSFVELHKQTYTSRSMKQPEQILLFVKCFRCQLATHCCLKPFFNRPSKKYECPKCIIHNLDPLFIVEQTLVAGAFKIESIFHQPNRVNFLFKLSKSRRDELANNPLYGLQVRCVRSNKIHLSFPMQGQLYLNPSQSMSDITNCTDPSNLTAPHSKQPLYSFKPLMIYSSRQQRSQTYIPLNNIKQLSILKENVLSFFIPKLNPSLLRDKYQFEEKQCYFMGVYLVRKYMMEQMKGWLLEERRFEKQDFRRLFRGSVSSGSVVGHRDDLSLDKSNNNPINTKLHSSNKQSNQIIIDDSIEGEGLNSWLERDQIGPSNQRNTQNVESYNLQSNNRDIVCNTTNVIPPYQPYLPAQQFLQVSQTRIRLQCPYTLQLIRFPIRGKYCSHFNVICLQTLLITNSHSRKWRCPICMNSMGELYVDIWILEMLRDIVGGGGGKAASSNRRVVIIKESGDYQWVDDQGHLNQDQKSQQNSSDLKGNTNNNIKNNNSPNLEISTAKNPTLSNVQLQICLDIQQDNAVGNNTANKLANNIMDNNYQVRNDNSININHNKSTQNSNLIVTDNKPIIEIIDLSDQQINNNNVTNNVNVNINNNSHINVNNTINVTNPNINSINPNINNTNTNINSINPNINNTNPNINNTNTNINSTNINNLISSILPVGHDTNLQKQPPCNNTKPTINNTKLSKKSTKNKLTQQLQSQIITKQLSHQNTLHRLNKIVLQEVPILIFRKLQYSQLKSNYYKGHNSISSQMDQKCNQKSINGKNSKNQLLINQISKLFL